jgi:hypothetical protein
MPTDTNVNGLVINKLTIAQYDAIQNPSETELYLVEEDIDTTPTSGSKNPVTSGGVYTALQGKADASDLASKEDKVDIVSASGATLSAQVGKYYTLSNVGTLAITLPTIASGTTKVQTVTFYIAAGSSPGVTFTSTHPIIYPVDYTIEANGLYEISAAWNGIGWIIGQLTLEIPT